MIQATATGFSEETAKSFAKAIREVMGVGYSVHEIKTAADLVSSVYELGFAHGKAHAQYYPPRIDYIANV